MAGRGGHEHGFAAACCSSSLFPRDPPWLFGRWPAHNLPHHADRAPAGGFEAAVCRTAKFLKQINARARRANHLKLLSSPLKKYLRFSSANQSISLWPLSSQRAFAIVRTQAGMRVAPIALIYDGRANATAKVVLGPDAACLASNSAKEAQATVARRADHRGDHTKTRKPLRV